MKMAGQDRKVDLAWRQMVIAGAVAALAWLLVAGLVSAVMGTGFWAPWVLMAAMVSRNADGLTTPVDFDFPAVTLGFVVQLVLSVLLATLFGGIAARSIKRTSGLIASAILFGLVVFLLLWYVARPGVAPATFELSSAAYALGYLAWGATLGLLVGRGVTFR